MCRIRIGFNTDPIHCYQNADPDLKSKIHEELRSHAVPGLDPGTCKKVFFKAPLRHQMMITRIFSV
jgi:hypothetical protein